MFTLYRKIVRPAIAAAVLGLLLLVLAVSLIGGPAVHIYPRQLAGHGPRPQTNPQGVLARKNPYNHFPHIIIGI